MFHRRTTRALSYTHGLAVRFAMIFRALKAERGAPTSVADTNGQFFATSTQDGAS